MTKRSTSASTGLSTAIVLRDHCWDCTTATSEWLKALQASLGHAARINAGLDKPVVLDPAPAIVFVHPDGFACAERWIALAKNLPCVHLVLVSRQENGYAGLVQPHERIHACPWPPAIFRTKKEFIKSLKKGKPDWSLMSRPSSDVLAMLALVCRVYLMAKYPSGNWDEMLGVAKRIHNIRWTPDFLASPDGQQCVEVAVNHVADTTSPKWWAQLFCATKEEMKTLVAKELIKINAPKLVTERVLTLLTLMYGDELITSDAHASLIAKIHSDIGVMLSKALLPASVVAWEQSRKAFHHDWLVYYIIDLGAFINKLAEIDDEKYIVAFVRTDYFQWEQHTHELEWLLSNYELHMSPKALFDVPPCRCPLETKRWLIPLVHQLWYRHCSVHVVKHDVEKTLKAANRTYTTISSVLRNEQPCRIDTIMQLKDAFLHFREQCQTLSDHIHKLKTTVSI